VNLDAAMDTTWWFLSDGAALRPLSSDSSLCRTWDSGPIQCQEAQLLEVIRTLPFEEAQYKEWRARRRIVSYGGRYDFTHHELTRAPPIPHFLQPLRVQLASWAGIPEERMHSSRARHT